MAVQMPVVPIANPVIPVNNERDDLLNKIEQACSINELDTIYEVAMDSKDAEIMQAYMAKQRSLSKALEKEINKMKKAVSTFIGPYGTEITDQVISDKVVEQIPRNTYLTVKVTTIPHYQFVHGLLKARKIELIRENWGVFNIPFFDSIQAGFSAFFKTDSIYRKVISSNTLLHGILASSLIVGDPDNGILENAREKTEFENQMVAAYWSGKTIEIIVPFDFSENGVITIISASRTLAVSIDSGRWLRSLFVTESVT